MNNCLVCEKEKKYPICQFCKRNQFKVEECRQILASTNKLQELKRMYGSIFPEIKNLNTSSFWNQKLHTTISFAKQDGMTKERVITAFSYIPKTTKKILDIGAGYGFLEEVLSKNNYSHEVYGFDISRKAINNLKKRFKGNFITGSIYDPPYKNNYFETICALEVLEHIPPSKIFFVLQKIKNLLRSKGIFILSIPLNEDLKFKKENPSGHLREYTKDLIMAELSLAGFRVVQYKELFAFSSLYRLKSIFQKWVFRNRWKPNDIVIKAIKV